MDKKIDKFLGHIKSLFGIDCAILDTGFRDFLEPQRTFCHNCKTQCDYKSTHLYGCYESMRWDNKYIYYCPLGLIFIAVPIWQEPGVIYRHVVCGPILMGDDEDFSETYGLKSFDTSKVNDMAEIISSIFNPIFNTSTPHSKEEFLNSLYSAIDNNSNYSIELEKDLQEYISNRDEKNCRECLNKILARIFLHSNTNLKTIKTRVLELIVLLSRSAIDGGADIDRIFNMNNNYIEDIENFKTLEDLSVWLTDIIHRYIGYMFEFTEVKHTDIIYKITAYINQNYMKKISLDTLANEVYLSKSYISKIFKEEMQISLSEYIKKVRIEKSKALLLDSSLSLVEIANLVGFEDQSYFTKIFKTNTGVSPGKFREKHGKI